MSKITSKDIQRLGELARIGIGKKQADELAPQLLDILDYVAKLQSVDTKDTVITAQVTGLQDVWREDEAMPPNLSREELLSNAPQTKDGYIKVRRVL